MALALLIFCAAGCGESRLAEDGVPPGTLRDAGEPAPYPASAQSVGEARI